MTEASQEPVLNRSRQQTFTECSWAHTSPHLSVIQCLPGAIQVSQNVGKPGESEAWCFLPVNSEKRAGRDCCPALSS